MFQFKGTIIMPNMKTQSWYIQRVGTLWDPVLFTIVLTLKFMHKYMNFSVNTIVNNMESHSVFTHVAEF